MNSQHNSLKVSPQESFPEYQCGPVGFDRPTIEWENRMSDGWGQLDAIKEAMMGSKQRQLNPIGSAQLVENVSEV
jgi:hypothetical protein